MISFTEYLDIIRETARYRRGEEYVYPLQDIQVEVECPREKDGG